MGPGGFELTNTQVRMIASVIGIIAGAIAAGTSALDVNVGIVIILLSTVIIAVEYVRSLREDRDRRG